ncbi:MAG: hypothetical protein P4L61_02465 [Candidatus Pacebacteria bacterium]|nr:hypothetical protein [Candidatus Paceibacterota bacterium]
MKDILNVKPGFRFKEGNVSFCVTSRVPGKEDMWNVQSSVPSSGFKRTMPKAMEMSTKQIQKIAEDYTALNAICNMQTTGVNAGEQSRRHSNRHTPFVFRTVSIGRLEMRS